MSGPLAVIREALAIFDPQRFQTMAALGHWLIIAFIVSSFTLLITERNKIKDLEEQLINRKPNFNADFNVSEFWDSGSRLTFGDHADLRDAVMHPSGYSGLRITPHITNTGAPSILKNIEVAVEIDNKLIQGGESNTPVSLHKEREEDFLIRKYSSQPIITNGGATGIHEVSLPKNITRNDIYRAGTIVIFSFQDVLGKRYEFKKVMKGLLKRNGC
jgi:hypothetical protein